MTKINSRAKGSTFERQIAADLRAWLGDGWTVTRAQTDRQRGQAADGHAGEFVIEHGALSFPWAIECKAHARLDLRQLWRAPVDGPLPGWWMQTVRQARAVRREPLLVVKVARGETLAVLRPGLELHGPMLTGALLGEELVIVRWAAMGEPVRAVSVGEVRA